MKVISNIIDLIGQAIDPEGDKGLTGGNIIADGYDEVVDNYRKTISSSKDWLGCYQKNLIAETSITSLKIKYTAVSGYFIEVSKNQAGKVPSYFVHKQTLVNAARFITEDLLDFQGRVLEAESSLAEREYEIFIDIRNAVLESFIDIKALSEKIGTIDFLANNSFHAYKYDYCKPKVSKKYDLHITKGRHPIIEQGEKNFISNDLDLSENKFIHILTGPNMGGKSTFLRQNALIILLAHMGSFVPAKEAYVGLIDKLFSRVGANDNLFLGQSTFMVEMQEVANILNNSTKDSFVIIDEVGRGTSTYDGMSIAWAILKENHDNIKAKTLFATHYHELIDESVNLDGVENFSVSVGEQNGELIFLRKIIKGGVKKSFGLEVAQIAGLHRHVIAEARQMLTNLERQHRNVFGEQLSIGDFKQKNVEVPKPPKESALEKVIRDIEPNNLTPIEALNIIINLKSKL